MSNHLINEKSPYLLQHAENPVDWYPWAEEAFRKARQEEKPIFLSIGYATCHWCHVMAHESFEDQEVAQLLSQAYVAIKVDREERPDIDQVYMSVCQALTGRGGWPLSIFMTPEGKPFFAGTYFPRTSRLGMSGFSELLKQIAALWEKDRSRVLQAGQEVTRSIQSRVEPLGSAALPGQDTLEAGYGQLLKSFDPRLGGFGQAPKFPTPHHLLFLIRWDRRHPESRAREMVEKTLLAMRNGGLFDQVGLGFHRYSVDEKWLVPHFEKMLYDQALLAMAYIEAFQSWQAPFQAQVAREIFTYVLRDMTAPEGGFYSAEDADSEGQEGLFYVWTREEIKKILGEETGGLFCRCYDIREGGNFDGQSIPNLPLSLTECARQERLEPADLEKQLDQARRTLFKIREGRVHPLKDDKILTAWNGLMIAALAKGAQALNEPAWAEAAARSARFILERMRDPDGRLYRRYRDGHLAQSGFLDDYAFLIWGLLDLYEATFDLSFLEEALTLNRIMLDLFWDDKEGGCFFTPKDGEVLIAREKDISDGALPSGNSVVFLNLLRLARITGNPHWEEKAGQLLGCFSSTVAPFPMAYTQFLCALDFTLGPAQEIVVAGDLQEAATREIIRIIRQLFLPNKVLLLKTGGLDSKPLSAIAPFVETMQPLQNRPTVFLCRQQACRQPITDLEELKKTLALP